VRERRGRERAVGVNAGWSAAVPEEGLSAGR
jgi:hypothetical protein